MTKRPPSQGCGAAGEGGRNDKPETPNCKIDICFGIRHSDFAVVLAFVIRHLSFLTMYRNILIPLEKSPADETILSHIKPLARMTGAKLLLVHVSDGWVARNFNQLKLAESEEMKEDRAYLEKRSRDLTAEGFSCDAVLALGEPSDEIIKLAREKDVDLIAMTTHGHRFVSDILYGATADKVRHEVDVPVLLLKVKT